MAGETQAEKVPPVKEKKKTKEELKKEEEMSEEDLAKKNELELLVERVLEDDAGVGKAALDQIRDEIRTATSSMTSVPKPLKFLRPHYDALKARFEQLPSGENKTLLSDTLSVLAMTMAKEGTRESLQFKLTGSMGDIESWGHEFVRNLAGEIGSEWHDRSDAGKDIKDLRVLVDEIVPFHIRHNAEPDACDLLLEVDLLNEILNFVDADNYARIGRYLTSCADYIPEPDDTKILEVVRGVYLKAKQYPEAMRVAIRLGDTSVIQSMLDACEDKGVQKQMAYLLARSQVANVESEDESVQDIISNTALSEHFVSLARDLDVWEAKTAEDIYKSHLDSTRTALGGNVDSARQNLATTFVNGFLNCGFGHDKQITGTEGNKWVYRNKDHGKMSAAASLGLILMWDVDGGLSQIDKFLWATDDYIKAGALIAVGVVNSSIRNECDPALALLAEHVEADKPSVCRTGSIVGLGLAYAGTQKEGVMELLTPLVADTETPMEIFSLASLSLGLVYVGSCNDTLVETIMQGLLERDETALGDTMTRFACLALGLLFLGTQESADTALEALKALPGQTGEYCRMTVETCAYAGTGNVMKAQHYLQVCADHLEEDNSHQAVAALGLALCAQGEELGAEMSLRMFEHMLQYGEPNLRRVVPLCIGLLNISNPKPAVIDMLSRLSHDSDAETAMGAIFALGCAAAGTNNARVAQMMRQLVQYYSKDPNCSFVVRLAQGLVHMGKGLMTLNPQHSDRLLTSRVGLGGLLVVMHAMLDTKNILLGRHHYMLFYLAASISPRMLMTVDEEGNGVSCTVRVGQAVDTIGQAGRPKTITGFQTHTTPVLLMYDQRAEMATDEYLPLSPVLEGFVIVRKNPAYVEP